MNEEIKKILDIENYRNKYGYVEDINLLPSEIDKLLDYITNLQEENQNLINGIDEINKCMKKYEKTSVDDAKTIITFYKQLKNILNKLTELKKGE